MGLGVEHGRAQGARVRVLARALVRGVCVWGRQRVREGGRGREREGGREGERGKERERQTHGETHIMTAFPGHASP
jgi:hypothetical protein